MSAVYTASADYAEVIAALRLALRQGTNLSSAMMQKAVDIVVSAANTLDSKGVSTMATVNTEADALELLLVDLSAAAVAENTLSDALEALLVTHLAILDGMGTSDASAEIDAAIAALATPRTDLIAATTALVAANALVTTARATTVTAVTEAVAADAATITDITTSDFLDGRSA